MPTLSTVAHDNATCRKTAGGVLLVSRWCAVDLLVDQNMPLTSTFAAENGWRWRESNPLLTVFRIPGQGPKTSSICGDA
jgi:hypothetical protein